MARIVVVLPMPLRPSSVTTSPAPTVEARRRTAPALGRSRRSSLSTLQHPRRLLAEIGLRTTCGLARTAVGRRRWRSRGHRPAPMMRSASANTASMSCSTSTIGKRALECVEQPRPAVRFRRGRFRPAARRAAAASAPWRARSRARARASRRARVAGRRRGRAAPRPTCASAASAGSFSAASSAAASEEAEARPDARLHRERDVLQRREARQDRGDLERAREPARARACTGSRVTSSPPNRMRPASGASSPEIWLISVVLPAPLGPIIACSSPGATSSETSSVTRSPPKFFAGSRCAATGLSHGAAPPKPRQKPEQAAAREQHDQHQQRPEDHLPVLGQAGEPLLGSRKAAAPMIAPLSVPRPPRSP